VELYHLPLLSGKDKKGNPGLARYQRPRHYKFVKFAELPFNPSGKKQHHILKECAAEDFPDLAT
jgi:acyl-coenzyme A synthetase/AMP-(fatty) acid ligase